MGTEKQPSSVGWGGVGGGGLSGIFGVDFVNKLGLNHIKNT